MWPFGPSNRQVLEHMYFLERRREARENDRRREERMRKRHEAHKKRMKEMREAHEERMRKHDEFMERMQSRRDEWWPNRLHESYHFRYREGQDDSSTT